MQAVAQVKDLLDWAISRYGGKREFITYLATSFDRDYAETTLNSWISGRTVTPRKIVEMLRHERLHAELPDHAELICKKLCIESPY